MREKFKRPGSIVLELEPQKGNPRNSEGAFIKLKNGSILFVYSKFTGKTSNDDDAACIAAICSKDNGETWSGERIIAVTEEHGAKNLMSVSLLRMDNDDIGLFYLIKYGWEDTRLCIRRSSDEGATWGEKTYCMGTKGYYETNNDRIIMLSNGRIIVPAAYYRLSFFEDKPTANSFKGMALFYISDDDGYTWRESAEYCFMPVPKSKTGLQETGVIELKNGCLWAWFRTDMGYQYESYSRDCGDTWTQPQPSAFTSCDSPLSMKRIPDTRTIMAVFNPVPSCSIYKVERNPFVIALSKNDGRIWSELSYLENPYDKGVGYCYTAIHFTDDDAVLLAYGAGECDKKRSCLERLRIQKISIL